MFRSPKVLGSIVLIVLGVILGTVTVTRAVGGLSAGDKLVPYFAVLNAGQESTPPASTALGVAFLFHNKSSGELTYSITFQGLGSNAAAAHIHGPAGPGEDANIRLTSAVLGCSLTAGSFDIAKG